MTRSPRRLGRSSLLVAITAGLLISLIPAASAAGWTRAERRDRAEHLNFGVSLGRFIEIANGGHGGIDDTLNWSNDGCSVPDWIGGSYNDTFHRSCRRHDFGYRNFGKNYYSQNLALASWEDRKRRVDSQFRDDMHNQCNGNDDCVIAAETYYEFVSGSGLSWTAFYAGECHPGHLCVFDDDHYEDRRKMLDSAQDDFNDIGFGDKTSSVKNRDNVAWRLYDDSGYSDTSVCIPSGGERADLSNAGFGDKTSSARPLSTSYCP